MWLVLSFAPTAQASPQIRLAVIDFQPSGEVGEYETLGAGLQSMLTTDLAAVATITVVERAQLAALQRELKLSRSALADPKTALRVGKLAGASHLLAGSFTLVANKMRLDARVIDVATAKVHFAAKIEGEKDAFFELEKNLAAQVMVV
jgi:TolB-like protein